MCLNAGRLETYVVVLGIAGAGAGLLGAGVGGEAKGDDGGELHGCESVGGCN